MLSNPLTGPFYLPYLLVKSVVVHRYHRWLFASLLGMYAACVCRGGAVSMIMTMVFDFYLLGIPPSGIFVRWQALKEARS